MSNKIFVDSSILIEAFLGRRLSLYQKLVAEHLNDCYINSIVASEFLYYFIGAQNLGSPKSVTEKKATPTALQNYFTTNLLDTFNFLEINSSAMNSVPTIMATYNLLPNDAIILATCKLHGITTLASHDSDFITPCKQERITLLIEE